MGKVQETCDRVGEFDGAGWTQKGSQYAEARYGLRDTGKLLPYYEKAAGMGDEHAQATVAFWKYMGYYCQPDREEGKRIFAKLTTPEGLRWKKFYQACIENYAGNEGQARQLRQELLEVLSEKDRMRAHIYAVIGDELDNDETKTAEQAEYYKKALAIVPNFYVQKSLGTLYMRNPELGKSRKKHSNYGKAPGNPEYGRLPTSWDIIIKTPPGPISPKQLNGWKKECFIVNHTVLTNLL